MLQPSIVPGKKEPVFLSNLVFYSGRGEGGEVCRVKVSRATHPGVVIEWGAKCGINNLPAIWRCKELCQHLGMDYVSASGSLLLPWSYFRGVL